VDDPRIQLALQRGLINPQALAQLRTQVPPQQLWSALCAGMPQLATLGQSSTGAALTRASGSDVAPTLVQASGEDARLEHSSDVAPTLVQPTTYGGPAPATNRREQAVRAYREARAEDPRFMPHANLVLHPQAELGRGGMGVVHRVRDDRLGREAALKLLSDDYVRDRGLVARFLREAELTAALDHPAIPPIYEAGTLANGQPFLLMKVIEGRPFSDVLRAAGPRPEGRPLRELLEVVVKVGEAVAHAHGRGILHRDLKPANVMVGELGEVMVVDWGLARRIGEEDSELTGQAPVAEGLTQAGAVLGTPGYLPPEQADGARVDERADVFALGAILTEVLTGKPPVTGASVANKLAATLQGKIAAPRDRRRDVPAPLDAIARCALASEVEERTQTAAEFVADLRAFLADEPVGVYPEGPLARARRWGRRHPAFVAVAGVTVACTLVFGGVAGALYAKAESERALADKARDEEQRAKQAEQLAVAEAENAAAAQASAEKARAGLKRFTDKLEELLAIERLPLDDKQAVEGEDGKPTIKKQLQDFEKAIPGDDPHRELMLRQLARTYVLRSYWPEAARAYLEAARATPPESAPPFEDVFQSYALRVTRTGYDEFVRHEEGRGAYFGDLEPDDLDELADKGWPAASGFPAFARALRATCSEADQDLERAAQEAARAYTDFDGSPANETDEGPGVRAAILILRSHVAFHLGEAARKAGSDPRAHYRQSVELAEAALQTQAHLSFAHFLRALSLQRLINPNDGQTVARTLDACERALAQDATLGLVYTVRQQVHRILNAPPLMREADHTAALRFRPEDGQLHHWRGQNRLTLAQQNAGPWGTVGWARQAQLDFEFAVERWDAASQNKSNGFNVGQLNSRVQLSQAFALQGKLPQALEVLETCERLARGAGDSPPEQNAVRDALTAHVGLLVQNRQLDAAGPRLERLLQRWPRDPYAVYLEGLYVLTAGDRQRAQAALQELEQLAPGSHLAQDLRAKLGG